MECCVREEENNLVFFCQFWKKTSLKDLWSRDNQYGRYFNKWRIKKKKQIEQELKQNWIEKKMYGQFIREMPEKVDENKTWQ